MSERHLGSLPSDQSGDLGVLLERRRAEPPRRRATDRLPEDSSALTRFEQEQLTREFADIERASAALQRVQPALQSWKKPEPAASPKARPLWLVIGMLWLSIALLAGGALAALATLAG